eukprot:Gb_02882 [translate_table: standard]
MFVVLLCRGRRVGGGKRMHQANGVAMAREDKARPSRGRPDGGARHHERGCHNLDKLERGLWRPQQEQGETKDPRGDRGTPDPKEKTQGRPGGRRKQRRNDLRTPKECTKEKERARE